MGPFIVGDQDASSRVHRLSVPLWYRIHRPM